MSRVPVLCPPVSNLPLIKERKVERERFLVHLQVLLVFPGEDSSTLQELADQSSANLHVSPSSEQNSGKF